MLTRLRPRISYANVVATLALFAALGGGAYAAATLPKNSVGAKQLKKDAVRSGKIKDRTILRKDVKLGQFATPGQLKSVNAAKLGGIAPSGFVHGTGHLVDLEYDATAHDDSLMPIRGGGAIALRCSASGYNVYVRTTGDDFDVFQWFALNGDSPIVQRRHVSSGDGLAFIPITDNSVFELDAQGAHGALAATVWADFDNTTKHCVGRIRGIAFP